MYFWRYTFRLKQIEDQSRQVEEALHEADKPLARYKDDDDLDQMLREQDRAEDPMLAFIKKKKVKGGGPAVKGLCQVTINVLQTNVTDVCYGLHKKAQVYIHVDLPL